MKNYSEKEHEEEELCFFTVCLLIFVLKMDNS